MSLPGGVDSSAGLRSSLPNCLQRCMAAVAAPKAETARPNAAREYGVVASYVALPNCGELNAGKRIPESCLARRLVMPKGLQMCGQGLRRVTASKSNETGPHRGDVAETNTGGMRAMLWI